MNDQEALRSLLRRWRHEPAAAPEFAAGVWARIEAGRGERRSATVFRWALPLAASLALLAGVGFARQESRREHAERMAEFYVRTIDPVQMVAHHAHR